MSGGARIDRLVTSGTFSLDGGTWDVDNNIWIVGDDHEVIVCTHAHDDHVNAAPQLADLTGAPMLLHPADCSLSPVTPSCTPATATAPPSAPRPRTCLPESNAASAPPAEERPHGRSAA